MWNAFIRRLARGFRSRYVLLLEEELARLRRAEETLRAENRALINSLLGTAGIPPIEPDEPARKLPVPPAVRRRSWFQIQAQREMAASRTVLREEEARKARAGNPVSAT